MFYQYGLNNNNFYLIHIDNIVNIITKLKFIIN